MTITPARSLAVLVLLSLLAGCVTTTPPPATTHRERVETSSVSLHVHYQSPPDADTGIIVEHLADSLDMLSDRLPRGLRDDHVDVYLLDQDGYDEYVEQLEVGRGEDYGNVSAFHLAGPTAGRNARLFMSRPEPSADPVLDEQRRYRATFEAIHEMTHAWLGRRHLSDSFNPSTEGLCNWIAIESLRDEPAQPDHLANSLAVEAIVNLTTNNEAEGPWRVHGWALSTGEMSYAVQQLFIDWLYRATNEDDERFRALMEDFLGTYRMLMDDDWFEQRLKSPNQDHDDAMQLMTTVDDESLAAWIQSVLPEEPLPGIDASVTNGSLARQGDGRWLIDPDLCTMIMLVGDPGTWSDGRVQIHPAIRVLSPECPITVTLVDSDLGNQVIQIAAAADQDTPTGRELWGGVVDNAVEIRLDGTLINRSDPISEEAKASIILVQIADPDQWPQDAPLVLEPVTP
ncbi:MAG: hypothetical protein MK116_08565 [Phycisphaerales bacterium]|nr:hypothetical protein [Phycisphaerales bacterium]